MQILRIADVPDNRTGGMSRASYGTGDVLRSRGHRVDYVFREQIGVVVPDKLRRFAVPPALVRVVRQRQRECRYDVVEIHEPLAAAYCVARHFDPGLPPLVAFSHGLEDRGHEAELDYLRAKGLRPSLKQRWSPLSVVWQARYAVRHADHVVCLNSADLDHLVARGVPRERITLLHSGIEEPFLAAGENVAALEPEPAARAAGVLFLGTWIRRKGALDVAAAMRDVLRRSPAARFTIAGCHAAPASVLAEVPADLHSRIEVIPRLEGSAEVMAVLARHSILLLPSFYEGHPIAMIEAAAMQLAIVTTPICGMADFIEDGRNGRFVPIGDAARLAEVTLNLIENGAERRRLGAAAHATAQRYTWDVAADALLAAYRKAARANEELHA